MPGRTVRTLAKLVALASCYFVAARLGLLLDAVSGFATLVWLPTGIALAALLLGGARFWPAIWLGAFAVNAFTGAPPAVAFGIACGNTLEAVVAALLLRRVVQIQPSLGRLRDVVGLVLLAGFCSTTLSATIGVSSLLAAHLIKADQFGLTWRVWWVGDMIGDLVVAPLLLVWLSAPKPTLDRRDFRDAVGILALLLGVGGYVFFRNEDTTLRHAYILFPVLILGAVRCGPRGATACTLIVSAITIAGTVMGQGPFIRVTLSESLLFLQSFMAVVAITTLTLGAAVAERKRAIEDLKVIQSSLERRVEERTQAISKAKQALESSEAQLSEAEAIAHLGSWEWDVLTNRLSWSKELYRIYGLNTEEFGANYQAYLERQHPEDRERVRALIDRALAAKGSFDFDHRIQRPDGSIRIVAAAGQVVVDGEGQAVRMIGTAQDITERRSAEETLRTTMDLYQALLTAQSDLGEGMALVDAQTERFLYVNDALCHMYGYSRAELLGLSSFAQVVAPDQVPVLQERAERRLRGEPVPAHYELAIVRKDGRRIDIEISVQPAEPGGSSDSRLVAIIRDITERRQAAAQLHQAHAELERRVEERTAALKDANARLQAVLLQLQQALASRDQFLSIASHELKTPLTSLQLQSDGLVRAVERGRTDDLTPERIARRAGTIQQQTLRLANLVNDLLDVSRITAGRMTFDYEEVDLLALVNDSVSRHGELMARAQSTVSVRTDGSRFLGEWDRMRLDQVLTNLLTNASKYGAGKPVEIGMSSDADTVRVAVTDHGIGIAPDDVDRIFERFERAASERHFGGLGLGLWISRQIVEGMSGTIRVESEMGKGSTFTVELPRLRPRH